MNIHAGLIASRHLGTWRGALILGPSGSGKSDLMLRALDLGLTLVADDRVIVWVSGGKLYGRAPEVLRDRIEARGVNVLGEPATAFSQIVLAVRCQAPDSPLDRLAPDATEAIGGVAVPLLPLRALEPSSPAKLRRALVRVGGSEGWG